MTCFHSAVLREGEGDLTLLFPWLRFLLNCPSITWARPKYNPRKQIKTLRSSMTEGDTLNKKDTLELPVLRILGEDAEVGK